MVPGARTDGKSGRFVIGCTFVVCLAIAVLMAFVTALGVGISLAEKHSPGEPFVQRAILVGVTSGLVTAFFALVAKRLYSEWRGQPLAHVIPVWIAVPISFALGVGSIVTIFTAAHHGYTGGAGGIFIGYAAWTTWKWLKRKPATDPTDGALGRPR